MPLNEFARRVMPKVGMGDMVQKVDAGLCPFCGKTVDPLKFRDPLSYREWKISGLCQECQDETFSEVEE